MHLSVIIPAFNEEKIILSTLDNISAALGQNSVPGFTWEIIVCDNNSSDNTSAVASGAGAKVVFEPVNQISRARNAGAGAATGDWLLFIDADTHPGPALITDVLTLIDRGKYIGCGSTIEVMDGSLFNKLSMERLNPFYRFLNVCGGAFLLCSKEAFDNIEGFSDRLWAYEELDFVIRLKRYGRRQGRKFTVLHNHPVRTSGRKVDFNFIALTRLFFSTIAAIMLYLLHFIIPKKVVQKLSKWLLGFWYNGRR